MTIGKKSILALLLVGACSFSTLRAQSILDKLKKAASSATTSTDSSTESTSKNSAALDGLSTTDVSSALKQALNIGVSEGIEKLGAEDGFYKNALTKILLPEQLRKVETTLRSVGLGSLADRGILLLNRAAEDAVKEGAPIFANAITSMSFDDAKQILLGDSIAATSYLKTKTSEQLFTAFEPKVENSLGKVGADKAWEQMITQYNTIARQDINTDLNAYVTEQTVNGVFKMVAEKESGIRNNSVFRTTSLLKNVFGALD
ncbi:DUF4197 domain-containing protein [Olivibacter sitiensis]|uniref:DUF4197 domain-containing protein n=1 Tax=Olivibacter sitiensis TaxID=376470 RepID=UPI00042060D4|nr:DUF4197 domain-containing protein [Olivibacter sitiensis]